MDNQPVIECRGGEAMTKLTARIWYDGKNVDEMEKSEREALGRFLNSKSMSVLGYKKLPSESGNFQKGKENITK